MIKNGLDTSRLINLIVCFESPDEFRMKDFPVPPHVFYINEISLSETVGVLINDFNMSKETAKRKIREWIEKYNLSIIRYDEICESYEEAVVQANARVIQKIDDRYKIGESDTKIIAGFLKEKVNIIHARDKGLESTCKELGLSVMSTPQRDIEKENSIKNGLKKGS